MHEKNDLARRVEDLLYAAGVGDPAVKLHVVMTYKNHVMISFYPRSFKCDSCTQQGVVERMKEAARRAVQRIHCDGCFSQWTDTYAIRSSLITKSAKALTNHVTLEGTPQDQQDYLIVTG